MLNSGQAGFVHAPITKLVIAAVVLTTVFGSIIGSQTRLTLRVHHVVDSLQVWRLLTHNFVFTTPGELLFGIVLLYFFRQFERQLGSSRFAAFAIVTACFHTAILTTLQTVYPTLVAASGPYSLIFASLVYFFFETPKVYHFQLLGAVDLSDKTFVYLLALQLVCSSPPRSLLSCAAALMAGILFRMPILRENADVPEPLVAWSSAYLLPLLGTMPRHSSRRARHRTDGQHNAVPGEQPTSTGSHERRHLIREPRDDDATERVSRQGVDTLVAMGFSREQSIEALRISHNDVHAATDRLLASSG